MRKLFTATFAIMLVASLVSGSVWAKSDWGFELYRTHEINGTQLKPGSYKLQLNGNNEADIYRKGKRSIGNWGISKKLITTATVEVRPLGNGMDPNSMLISGGSIREIRTKDKVIVFLSETASTPGS